MKKFLVFFLLFFLLTGCFFLDSNSSSSDKTDIDLSTKESSAKKNISNQTTKSQNIDENQTNNSETQGTSPTKSIFVNESINLTNASEKNTEIITPKHEHNILEIYFFDVGFGDSTLLRTKNFTILIGTGSLESSAALVEKLRNLGVKKIDELVLDSWLDTKIGGTKLILKRFPVNRVWISKEIPSSFFASETYSLIKQNNILVYNPKKGDNQNFDDLSIKVYNPQSTEYQNHPEANSIMLKIIYGNFCLFLPSDIDQELEPSIVSNLEKKPCALYKWRKNGEGRPTPSILFNHLEPKDVIISAGPTSKGEYPSKTTLSFISVSKAGLYRTDIDKDIFVNASKSGEYWITPKANLAVLGQWYLSSDANK